MSTTLPLGMLSEHFSLNEMTFSQVASRLGYPNDPGAAELANLARLCETLLEPARALLGVALHVDSGYRSEPVNAAVGGEPTSAHMEGRAADLVPVGMPIEFAFEQLRRSSLPFERILFECCAWIHIQVPPAGTGPARLAFTASGAPGNWRYQAVA